MRGRIKLIGHASVLGTPLGHTNGEDDVEHQGSERDTCKPHIKFDCQNAQNQGYFNQRGHYAIE